MPFAFRVAACLLPFAFCLLAPSFASAQKKPKPALSVKEARAVVAAAPGFKLKASAVKVKDISPAGASPVTVEAEVKEAFRLAWVEDERAAQDTGIFKEKRWRAVEFRTGERSWEEFDFLAAPLGDAKLEAARGALEELVTEYASRLGANKDGSDVVVISEGDKGDGKKKGEKKKNGAEPLTHGPLTIKGLSTMGSSAIAEVVVDATFRLSRDAEGKWVVTEVLFGGESSGDLAAHLRSVNSEKAERARADLATLRDALEAFRAERGFYVVAEDSVVLLDHLSPRYIKHIIRLDPWHNPYRYNGTTAAYTLASDGPDGKSGTSDDVTLSR
ncbi:MAG: hypothetical protein DMF65_05300 [Acidobacteria bacterium]|nr:MAG: hypothetical protein DMF65_05300 [Acidobacteriota bacterium]